VRTVSLVKTECREYRLCLCVIFIFIWERNVLGEDRLRGYCLCLCVIVIFICEVNARGEDKQKCV
jgi:hypothetical protein